MPSTTASAEGKYVLERAVPPLAGAALIGIVALDLSGVAKGEVERIWLPAPHTDK